MVYIAGGLTFPLPLPNRPNQGTLGVVGQGEWEG